MALILITPDEAVSYAVNSKNFIHRIVKVLDYKKPYEKHRGKYIKHLKKGVEDLDMDKIKDNAEKLENVYSYIIRSYDLILKILNHHIPRQKYYLGKLPDNATTRAALDFLRKYEHSKEIIEKVMIPCIIRQYSLIHKFTQAYGISDYIEFSEEFKKEIQTGIELFKGAHKSIKEAKPWIIKARKLKFKAEYFGDDHPYCMAFLEIGLSFAYGILGITAGMRLVKHHAKIVKAVEFTREHLFGGRLYSVDQVYYYPDYAEKIFAFVKQNAGRFIGKKMFS